METADVVVIGAGANGTSTAFHLAEAGVKRVVVVERQYLGSGATGKSGALVRMHYSMGSRCQMMTPTPLTLPVNRTGRTAVPPIPRQSKAVGNTFLPML